MRLPLYRKLKRALYIIGAGGHGLSLASVAMQSGFRTVQFIETESHFTQDKENSKASLNELLPELNNCSFAIAVGDNFHRERVTNDLTNLASVFNVKINFPNIIHPRANIGRFVELGKGNQIFPSANIGSGSVVQDFVIMNHLSSVDHQSSCAIYSSLAPGALTGGGVHLGQRSAILISASVAPQVCIGNDSVLAGNSFLKEDIADSILCGGSPARIIKNRVVGERYM